MIHSRNAWDDTFRVLDSEGVPARTIFHCFTGGPDEARAALDRDCYLSFSGIVSFKSADDVRAAAALAPADRVLVETDSPYLAPVPHRGQPNEPAFVSIVGAALAAARRGRERDRRARRAQRGAGVRRRAVTPSEIRALLDEHGLRPSKALGQNFLADTNMAEHIVRPRRRAAGRPRGGGRSRAGLVDARAVRRGATCARSSSTSASPVRSADVVEGRDVDVVEADALTVDWAELLADHERWIMVSNLPYNVATPVVVRALETAPMIGDFLVMVQREVGERLAAIPGTKAYGAVSVKVAYYARRGGRARFRQRCSCRSPMSTARREAATGAEPRDRPSPIRTGCSSSCAPGSPRGARCCGARSVRSWARTPTRRCASPGSIPRRAPRRWSCRNGPRSRTRPRPVSRRVPPRRAYAKLTLSLQVDRRADERLSRPRRAHGGGERAARRGGAAAGDRHDGRR